MDTDAEKLKKMLQQKEIDAITFFSPSSIENFTAIVPVEMIAGITIAVIGKSTAEAAMQSGLTVDIIANPSTSEGMVDLMQKYFEKRV